MLPCPCLPAFLPFAVLAAGLGAGLSFLDSGSSSEKDSQTASSLVTVRRVSLSHTKVYKSGEVYQDTRLHP